MNPSRLRSLLPCLLTLPLAACVHAARPAAPISTAWVELGPSGAIARLVTSADACPPLQLDSGAVPLRERARPSSEFPVRVCEAEIPASARLAAIEGQPLPLPPAHPKRVIVLGDTGCRLKGKFSQACNDPDQWPFPTAASTAAGLKPDLVIHVGDYLYRERPCLPGEAGCTGSPWGKDFATWQADFFQPAGPLLRAAPWVFVRGNHERCSRAGAGWFLFLDPRPLPQRCEDATEPWAVSAGDLHLLVMDTSSVTEGEGTPVLAEVQLFERRFVELGALASSSDWLLTHHPLWAVWAGAHGEPMDEARTLQQASHGTLPPGVKLILSGHVHAFEALSFADGRAPQVVAGGGGTRLSDPLKAALTGHPIAGTTVASAAVRLTHGFVSVERQGAESERLVLHDPKGAELLDCSIAGGRLTCAPEK